MAERYPIDGARDALWAATAVAAPDCERLDGALDVDVAVIGAGNWGINLVRNLRDLAALTHVVDTDPELR